jgi:hypothetical protein
MFMDLGAINAFFMGFIFSVTVCNVLHVYLTVRDKLFGVRMRPVLIKLKEE